MNPSIAMPLLVVDNPLCGVLADVDGAELALLEGAPENPAIMLERTMSAAGIIRGINANDEDARCRCLDLSPIPSACVGGAAGEESNGDEKCGFHASSVDHESGVGKCR